MTQPISKKKNSWMPQLPHIEPLHLPAWPAPPKDPPALEDQLGQAVLSQNGRCGRKGCSLEPEVGAPQLKRAQLGQPGGLWLRGVVLGAGRQGQGAGQVHA